MTDKTDAICEEIVSAIANNIVSSDGYGGLSYRGRGQLKDGLLKLVDQIVEDLSVKKPAEAGPEQPSSPGSRL